MKIRLKKFINKHKNRIFSFIAVFFCIPLFTFNAFAYTTDYPFYQFSLKEIYGSFDINGTYEGVKARTFPQGDDNIYWQSSSITVNNTNGLMLSMVAEAGESDRFFAFPVNTDLYDYYFIGDFGILGDMTLNLTSVDLYYGVMVDQFTDYTVHSISDVHITPYNAVHYENGYNFTGKINSLDINTSISAVKLNWDKTNFVGQIRLNFGVLAVSKDSSDDIASIISAINIQTDTLGGYIDKGNGSTGGIVSGNNSAIDNLDDVVSEYRATEETFFNDFNTNQQAITSDIVGWSWGGLVNCANWVGNTLTSYYNNMGDFRQYIIYPLMLGIALFFLGRGGSIIGHLFRKPTETTVNTRSVFRREGNIRYTTTTTSRQGGVFRK